MGEDDTSSKSADDDAGQGAPGPPADRERSATNDLSDGLELMLRAAKKALGRVDPSRLEELGRRAKSSVESWNRRAPGIGHKAADRFDPRRIEEIAEDAGRELLRVVERVAERVEGAVYGTRKDSERPDDADRSSEPADALDESQDGEPPRSRPRVRIADDD